MTTTEVLLIAIRFSLACQADPWEYDWLFLEDDNENGFDTGSDALEHLDRELKRLRDAREKNGSLGCEV